MSAPVPAPVPVPVAVAAVPMLVGLVDTVTKPVAFLPGGKYVHLLVVVLLALLAFRMLTGKLPLGLEAVCAKLPVVGEYCKAEPAAEPAAE